MIVNIFKVEKEVLRIKTKIIMLMEKKWRQQDVMEFIVLLVFN